MKQNKVSESNDEEISFNSPKMILEFLKAIFEQLSQCDKQE